MKKNCRVIYKYFRIGEVHEYAIILHAQEFYSSHNDVTSINKASGAKTFPQNIEQNAQFKKNFQNYLINFT